MNAIPAPTTYEQAQSAERAAWAAYQADVAADGVGITPVVLAARAMAYQQALDSHRVYVERHPHGPTEMITNSVIIARRRLEGALLALGAVVGADLIVDLAAADDYEGEENSFALYYDWRGAEGDLRAIGEAEVG